MLSPSSHGEPGTLYCYGSTYIQAGCPSCCPTNSVKTLKAKTLPICASLYRFMLSGTYAGSVNSFKDLDSDLKLNLQFYKWKMAQHVMALSPSLCAKSYVF